MTYMRLSGCSILLTLISQMAFAQGSDTRDREAAQKEIDGMRRYAWALANSTAEGLKKMPEDEFPAVHAFRRALHPVRQPPQFFEDPYSGQMHLLANLCQGDGLLVSIEQGGPHLGLELFQLHGQRWLRNPAQGRSLPKMPFRCHGMNVLELLQCHE